MRRIKILMTVAVILSGVLFYRVSARAFERKQVYEQSKMAMFRSEAKKTGMK